MDMNSLGNGTLLLPRRIPTPHSRLIAKQIPTTRAKRCGNAYAMSNPRNFELAKGLTMMGQAAGFDMSTQEGTKATMKSQNETVVGYQGKPLANSSNASQNQRRADQPHLLDSQGIVSSMNRKQRDSLLEKKRKNKKRGGT